ncbi:MAG: hypothetical protein ACLUR9_08480 [Christensenellales bacterium]
MDVSWNEISKEMLFHYYCEKLMSDQEIATLFGVTRSQVSYKRRYLKVFRKESAKANASVYQDRILGCLRVLGLSRLMWDPERHNELNRLLHVPFQCCKAHPEYRPIRISSFGNLLACSIELSYPDSFDKMQRLLSMLVQEYLGHYGYMLRGAVTIGRLYHDERLICGPAFIKAQRLEKNLARYPRIILKAQDLRLGLSACPAERRAHMKQKFILDRDGFYYLDGFYGSKRERENILLKRAKENLDKIPYESGREKEKVDWLKQELERHNTEVSPGPFPSSYALEEG